MDYKLYAKLAITGIIIFCAVQYSLVYVNRTQLKSIMESEALDARRANVRDEESLINSIIRRAEGSNIDIPEDLEIWTEGVEDDNPDLIVHADYTHPVKLLVYTHRLRLSIDALAEAPDQ
ncbi:MAG: hypothetical protein KC613_10845 [Myxococcales bacterium]|nr:hypothetical protein [Myxococcales bacterium]MCB9525509.1 hypothetical protein [Myxococcales bacterium]